MNARPLPTEIRRGDKSLNITWSDGHTQHLSSEALRRQCPCAACREARGDTSHAEPLTAKKSLLKIVEASTEEETTLVRIWAVGNYALGVEWKDGHNSGIYTFELLRTL